MAYPKEITDRAFEILAERRNQARNDYQYRQQVIARDVPAVEALRRELTGTSASIARAILSGTDVEEKLRRLRESNLYMQQRKRELLAAAGLPEQYDELTYSCPDCSDTGYTPDGKQCHCLKALLAELMLERLSRTANTDQITFDSFSLDYYPVEKLGGPDLSPREIMQQAYDQCRLYARQFAPDARSLFFQGPTGLGKTHLSLAIASEVIRRGYNVLYTPAQTLLDTLERERFRRGEENFSLDFVLDCDLLILDDLGSEFSTSFSVATIYNIINSRLIEKKPTIISSNLTVKEIEARYSPRVLSRIMGGYSVIPFRGSDIRMRKKQGLPRDCKKES